MTEKDSTICPNTGRSCLVLNSLAQLETACQRKLEDAGAARFSCYNGSSELSLEAEAEYEEAVVISDRAVEAVGRLREAAYSQAEQTSACYRTCSAVTALAGVVLLETPATT